MKALSRGAGWTGAAALSDRTASVVGLLLMARLLTPALLGQYAVAVAVNSILSQLVEIGADYTLLSSRRRDAAMLWGHRTAQLLLALAKCAFAVLIFFFLVRLNDQIAKIVVTLSFLQIATALGSTSRCTLQLDLRFRALAVVDAVAAISSAATGVLLAYAGFGVWALVIGGTQPALVYALVQSAGSIAVGDSWARWQRWPSPELRLLLRAGWPFWVGGQFVALHLQGDRVVVAMLLGSSAAGVYDVAQRIALVPVWVVQYVLGRVAVSHYVRSTGAIAAQAVRTQAAWAGVMLTVVVTIGLVADRTDVAAVVVGPQWASLTGVLIPLVVVVWIRALFGLVWAYLMSKRQYWTDASYNMVTAAVFVPLAFFLTPRFGIIGMVLTLATASAIGLGTALAAMEPRWLGSGRDWLKSLLPGAPLIIGVVAFVLLPQGSSTPLALVGVSGSVIAFVFFRGRRGQPRDLSLRLEP